MLGPGRWPGTGEIDIMEDVNGLSREAGTLHCGNLSQRNPDGTSGPCHEGTGLGSGLQPCPGCQQEFHTYTVIVDRRHASDEQIRWYLDGHEFFKNEISVCRWAWYSGASSAVPVRTTPSAVLENRSPCGAIFSSGSVRTRQT